MSIFGPITKNWCLQEEFLFQSHKNHQPYVNPYQGLRALDLLSTIIYYSIFHRTGRLPIIDIVTDFST